ncbi:MAG TPA: peptidoglycan DD-metalloendopeptidase family protein [Lachnospiraceae bacterium]|nr:peptidoglycan DD-metalloendopeptidase family protein [Lachnospiraceae bacterium]
MTTNSEEGNEEESTNSHDSSENEEADSNENSDSAEDTQEKKDYVKWVEFDVTYEAMDQAYQYDVESYGEEVKINWIDLLAYLGARYGGDFSRYKKSDMTKLVERLKSKEETMESITSDMKYYSYFREVYEAVLGGLVGEYEIQEQAEGDSVEATWVKKYGLKGYLPIAKFFPYNDYDDFGVSRSYGYKRRHLGHDMMGQVGTPIVAVESGYVEALGWNQYGGWRIGIRSFDGKRYYYYAHLRKNFPYNKSLVVGSIVQAGDVIGYLGRTGYSKHENVNNIDTAHLHFGLQLIFDESQKEGTNEIWIDCYNLVKFLYKNRCETSKNEATKEWYRIYDIKDPAAQDYIVNHPDAPVIEEAPGQKVTAPEEKAITPGDSSTSPEKKATEPSDSNTTPGESTTTPEKNATTSEENTTSQEQGN